MAGKRIKIKSVRQPTIKSSPLFLGLSTFRFGFRLPTTPAVQKAYHLKERIKYLEDQLNFAQPNQHKVIQARIRRLESQLSILQKPKSRSTKVTKPVKKAA